MSMEPSDPQPDRKAKRLGGRISLQTLIIASIASAAASFAASRIWGAGTIVSAAATPVVVALVSEFLRRPVQTVAETAKKVPAVQTSFPAVKRIIAPPIGPLHPSEQPADARPEAARPPQEPTATRAEPDSPFRESPQTRPAQAHAAGPPVVEPAATKTTAETWRPRWRLAIATGLLAFVIVISIYTVPDLLAGRSITGNGQPTTFFGGTTTVSKKTTSTSTVTTTSPTTTITKTAPTSTTTTTTSPTTTTTTTTSTGTTSASKPPGAATTQTTTTATSSTTPAP